MRRSKWIAVLLGFALLLGLGWDKPQTARAAAEVSDISARVPILMYHNLELGRSDAGQFTSPEKFARDMALLAEEGYNAVSFQELRDYVDGVSDLPSKPIVITFDDGYQSNYLYAYPILQQYGFKATIAVIAKSLRTDENDGLGAQPFALMTDRQAREMVASGLIEIQSHTYAMHRSGEGQDRFGVLAREGESPEEYARALREDFSRSQSVLSAATGAPVFVLIYPFGLYSNTSERVLTELGFAVTVTTKEGINVVVRGDPGSLRLMKRISVSPTLGGADLTRALATGRVKR